MDALAPTKVHELQQRNSKLHAELKATEVASAELEQKITALKEEQSSYADVLLCVNRFWDQLNEDVAYLCKRLAEFSEAASDELQKRIPDPFLWQLVAGHSRAEKEVRDREEELFRDASDVEKALTRRSQQMHTALSKLVERMTADRTSQPAAQLQEQDGQLQSELDSQLKALQQEVDAQYALNRILKAQIKQVDDKLALNEKATRDIANELADKTQMLSTARRKNFELQGGGQLSTQASLPAAPSRQDSYRAHITPDSLAAGGSSLDPLTKRTAELEKERESNILLQRELRDLRAKGSAEVPRQQFDAVQRQVHSLKEDLEQQCRAASNLHGQLEAVKRHESTQQSQVAAGELAKRQLAQADARIRTLQEQLTAAMDASRKAELQLQQERAAHGPAETMQELTGIIQAMQRDAGVQQDKLKKANASLQSMQEARNAANNAAKELQMKDVHITQLSHQSAQQSEQVGMLQRDIQELQAQLKDMHLFVEVLETFCDDPRDAVQARRDEARLKAELATIQANGNGNHAAAPEELEDLRAANAKLQERVTELQQTNGKLQVEIGDVQRRFDQVQQDLADAAENGEVALSEVDDIIEAHEAEKARNVRLLEQLAKQEATNAKLLTDKIHESQIVARHAEERDFAEAAAGRAKEDATNLRHCVNAVEGQLQTSREAAVTLQAKLREAEAAHDAAKAELRRREEADRATAAQLSEADRQQQELKRKADDDHANAARETAKRRRIEDDAKGLQEELDKLKERAAAGSNAALEAQLQALRRTVRCTVCQERQKDTIITKCHHTFCRECVTNRLDVRSRKCPTCGEKFGRVDVDKCFL